MSPARLPVALLLAAAVLTTPGCVRRRLTVQTNPPGALVYVDNQPIGTSPCSTDFTYYGTREIRMVKPGYETLTVNQPIPTPWYETPGVDFISENLVPLKIRDNRTVAFNLSPQRVVPAEELIGRGQELRGQAQAPPAIVPAGGTDPFLPLPAQALPAAGPSLPPPGPAPFRF
ncbi:MAG: PEGA domain-containing protein [Planctomycetota bacterium]